MYAKGTHSTTPGIREIRPSGLVSDIPLKESLEVKMEKSVKRLSASMPIRSLFLEGTLLISLSDRRHINPASIL
jgi:hypothetical protein